MLENVLGIVDWVLYWICFMLAGWLLLLSFSFHFISFHHRDHRDHKAFGVEIDKNLRFQKSAPQKVGPRYLLPPLLITSGSELTLFTNPLLITTPRYVDSIIYVYNHSS